MMLLIKMKIYFINVFKFRQTIYKTIYSIFFFTKSYIILIVVGQMTINEQLFINNFKKIFNDYKKSRNNSNT